MGRKPTVAETDAECNLVVRIPGWLKNDIHALCADLSVSMNQWALSVLRDAVRASRGLPEPPPAKVGLPTPADQIRAWAAGEKIMMPCGLLEPCPGLSPDEFAKMGFCPECQIRVR